MIWNNIFELFGVKTEEVIINKTSDSNSIWEKEKIKTYHEWDSVKEVQASLVLGGGIFLICFVAVKEVGFEILGCLRQIIADVIEEIYYN